MSGVVALIVASAFTLATAVLCWRLMRTGRPALDAALLGFLWIFAVTFLLFVFGLIGWLTSLHVGAASLAGLTAIALVPATRSALRGSARDILAWLPHIRSGWKGLPIWFKVISAAALILGLGRFAFLIWALPPFVWDALTYHLTNVAHWIQAGRIEVFETPVLRIYSPANYEVFATWFALFSHHDGWVEASGLPAFGVAGIAVYATARRLHLSRTASWMAALGYWSTPALVFAATGTKNDPLVTAVFLCLLAVIVDIARDVSEGRDRPFGPRLLALTLLVLYGLGTKPYLVHLLPGLLVIGIALAGPKRSLTALRDLPARLASEARARPRMANVAALGLLAAGLALGFYWYARNQALQGNPFYPYGVNVAGNQVELAEGPTFRMDLTNLWANLRLAAQKIGDKQRRIVPDLPDTTGWGWVAYGLGVPALVWSLVRRRPFRGLAAGFFVSGIVLLLSSPTSPWNMRYMSWFPALMGLALGAFFDSLMGQRRAASVFAGLVSFCLFLNFSASVNYNLIDTDTLRAMLARPFRDRRAADLRLRVPLEYENALTHVPRDALLGYNVHENGFVYPLYRSDFSQRVVYIPIDAQATCAQIADSLREAGTRYLVGAPEHTSDAVLALLHTCGEQGAALRELGVGLYVLNDS